MKIINYSTPAARDQIGSGIVAAILWLQKQPEDWFHKFEWENKTYFIEQNEEGTYTLLLPEEH